jgi:hypothetical protein
VPRAPAVTLGIINDRVSDTATGRTSVSRLPVILAVLVFAAMAVLTGIMVGRFGYLTSSRRPEFFAVVGALWVLFAVGLVLLRRVPARAAIVIILAASTVIGGTALLGPPNTSSDSARYAWDGIVQDAGISPYKYVPSSDALKKLRPDWLFSPPVQGASGPTCGLPRPYLAHTSPSGVVMCTAINRPSVPTIYPPASELLFAAVRAVVPPDAEFWPLQLAGLLMTLAVGALLVFGLRRRGLNPRWAALWAVNPLVISQAVTNSHIDILGSLLTLLAVFAIASGARWRGGILLGAAIAAKLIPILAAPAVLRRQPWKIIVAAVATFAVLYIPYIITTGIGVIGYLPGYLNEEGYNTGNRFVLLRAFLPGTASLVVAVLLLGAVAVLAIIYGNPERPWLGQLFVIGSALFIASPPYAWYSLLLVPFIAMTGRWEWLALLLAFTVRELVPSNSAYEWSLFTAAVIVAVVSLGRWDRARAGGRRMAALVPWRVGGSHD